MKDENINDNESEKTPVNPDKTHEVLPKTMHLSGMYKN